MRILTNVSKTELDHLTSQPTAKAMIEKVKKDGIYIPEGDTEGAAAFAASRKQQKQEDFLQISDEGRAALEKENETKEATSEEDRIREEIAELKKKMTEIKSQQANSEESQKAKEQQINAISQQISALSMQLIQVQKSNSEASSI